MRIAVDQRSPVRCGLCGGKAGQVWRFSGMAGQSFTVPLCRRCAPARPGNIGCDPSGVLWTATLVRPLAETAA